MLVGLEYTGYPRGPHKTSTEDIWHVGSSREVRTELQRRRQNESLQSLYNDICRLMSLAYPGPTSDVVNVVGRNAFSG